MIRKAHLCFQFRCAKKDSKRISISFKTNNLTLTCKNVNFKRDPLFFRTNHSCMFGNFNIKSVLTYEWKIFYFKTTKIDLDLDNMNPKINNNYALSNLLTHLIITKLGTVVATTTVPSLVIIKQMVHKILNGQH